jgi:hypothetical protein
MKSKFLPPVILLLGAIIFVTIYGYKIIDPTNFEWVMAGDPGQHFLGWHFFRSESWSFPLGIIQNYHYPSGTSLVFTDSIPLIAIPLKLFSGFLPKTFQYTGLWLLSSYMLQGLFASILLQKVTKNALLILLGTTFFLLSPIMFSRAGGHEALTAHWLILAAFCLYFSAYTKKIKTRWVILIIIATLVHFYLLVMVLAIWSGYLLRYILNTTNHTRSSIIRYFFSTLLIVILIMWIEGYFIIPFGSASTGEFGIYSMNILSPFNPMGGGNTFFLDKFSLATFGQYEGFNYLGFGLLLMGVIAFFKLSKIKNDFCAVRHMPLIFIMTLLYFFALSNKITMGSEVLIDFHYPWILNDVGNMLRSSGRMFWPVYYILMLVILSIIIKYFNRNTAIFILLLFLIVQIIDFYPWYSARDLESRTWNSPLESEDWLQIAKDVDHIVMIPPTRASDPNYVFSLYAADNNLDINMGYLARKDWVKKSQYNKKIMEDVLNNRLEERTLYVVTKKNLVPLKNQAKYLFGALDGYNIITPQNKTLNLYPWFGFSKKIPFDSSEVVFSGWSHPEAKQRWSLNKKSKILFSVNDDQNNQHLKLQGILSLDIRSLGKQQIIVSINDVLIGSKRINTSSKGIRFRFAPNILNKDGMNTIQFDFPDAKKPDNGDPRVLAMALRSFIVE